jgi:hypothetical protein
VTASLSSLDVTEGGNDDPGDVGGGRRLLSVAEIQLVLREVQTRGSRRVAAGIGESSKRLENGNFEQPAIKSERVPTARRPRGARANAPALGWGNTEGGETACRGDSASGTRQQPPHSGALEASCIRVLAAHAGAGASTVAVLISDAAAAVGRRVHLVDTAHPSRSGLVAAASEEVGIDATGTWRRGLRTGVTIDRRTTEMASAGWPVPPAGDGPAVTVVDLGLAAPEELTRLLAGDRTRLVVVCRPTVPGVRLTEHVLDQLAPQPVVVTAVGPSRWPGEVTASLGPRLRALRAAGRVVPVPMDRHLEVAGPTSFPLPKALRSAGRLLLELLDDSHPGAVARWSATTTDLVPTPEETHR